MSSSSRSAISVAGDLPGINDPIGRFPLSERHSRPPLRREAHGRIGQSTAGWRCHVGRDTAGEGGRISWGRGTRVEDGGARATADAHRRAAARLRIAGGLREAAAREASARATAATERGQDRVGVPHAAATRARA